MYHSFSVDLVHGHEEIQMCLHILLLPCSPFSQKLEEGLGAIACSVIKLL